jgi:hypothetical protein
MDDNRDPELATVLPDYLNMTINYNTFRVGSIILIIIIVIILIAGVSVASYSSNRLQIIDISKKYDMSRFSKRKLSVNVSRDIGASRMDTFEHISNGIDLTSADKCESLPYRKWQNGKCKCMGSYWGSSCHRELYGADYIDVGNFTHTEELPLISENYVHDKTFPYRDGNITCETLCTEMNGKCVGYIYTEMEKAGRPINKCQLLSDEPHGTVTYNPQQDGNLYLHTVYSSKRPKMKNKIILYNGNPIDRFWEKENEITGTYSFANIYFDQINIIHFIPTGYINDSNASIIYHNDNFSKGEAEIMERYFKDEGYQRDKWYVHIPGINGVTPPFSLFRHVIWVMGIYGDRTNGDILKLNKRISEMASHGPKQECKTHLHSSMLAGPQRSEDMSNPSNPYSLQQTTITNDTFSSNISVSSSTVYTKLEEESFNCNSVSMSSCPAEETLLRSEWSA